MKILYEIICKNVHTFMKKNIWTPTCVFNFFTFFERIHYKSNCIIFIFSWCATHTKIRSKLVVIVTAGSQKITLWGPQRTPLGILRVTQSVCTITGTRFGSYRCTKTGDMALRWPRGMMFEFFPTRSLSDYHTLTVYHISLLELGLSCTANEHTDRPTVQARLIPLLPSKMCTHVFPMLAIHTHTHTNIQTHTYIHTSIHIIYIYICVKVKVKVKKSRYSPEQARRVPGS